MAENTPTGMERYDFTALAEYIDEAIRDEGRLSVGAGKAGEFAAAFEDAARLAEERDQATGCDGRCACVICSRHEWHEAYCLMRRERDTLKAAIGEWVEAENDWLDLVEPRDDASMLAEAAAAVRFRAAEARLRAAVAGTQEP